MVWNNGAFRRVLWLAVMALAGCEQTKPKNEGQSLGQISSGSRVKPESFGPFVIGQDFQQALNVSSITWWGEDLDQCRSEMALKGCRLSAYGDSGVQIREGMAFHPTLFFGNTGKLAQLNYTFRVDGRIAQSDCVELFGRMKGLIEGDAGQLLPITRPLATSDIEAGWTRRTVRTSNGSTVVFDSDGPKAAFFVFSVAGPKIKKPVASPQQIQGLYASVSGTFVTAGTRAHCDLVYGLTDNSLPQYRIDK